MKNSNNLVRKGFTLIELLVVIAIIAILAAILFPVFAQAKAAAKKVADLSNMKQIDLGVIIYTNDYDDTYPDADMYEGNNPYGAMYRWSSTLVLGPYLKSTALFLSPLDSSYTVPPSGYGYETPQAPRVDYPISYMANALSTDLVGAYSAYFPAGISNYQGAFAPGSYWDRTGGAPYTPNTASPTTTRAAQPTNLIVFTGGSEQADQVAYCPNSTGTETIAGCYCSDLFWGFETANLASGTYYGSTTSAESQAAFTAWRKAGNSSNFAFSDGHAKNMQPGALLVGPLQLSPKYFLIDYTGN